MSRFLFCVNWLGMPNSGQYVPLAEHLADRGHRCVVLCANKSAGPTDHNVPDGSGVSVISWPNAPSVKGEDGLFFWRLLRDYRPDCVTGQFRNVNWAMVLGRLARVPVRVAWARTMYEEAMLSGKGVARSSLKVMRKRFVYRSATHVAVLTEAQMPQVERWFGVDGSKCVVVPNSLPAPEHLAEPADPPRIVSIGRLERQKCHSVLIEAFARVSRTTPCELVIVGDGELRGELAEHARRLGVEASVRFTGRLPHEEAMRELERATVCAHPGVAEAFGYAIIEALSRGVPVVASDDGGIPEVVGPSGECALLVPPHDPDSLAQASIGLLRDDAQRARLSEGGRRRFLERYHVDAWAKNVGSWLEEETRKAGRR